MRVLGLSAAAAALLILLSTVLDRYPRFLLGELAVIVMVAVGVNLVMGVAGMFSVASPAFLGLGATLTVALMIRGVPVPAAAVLALLLGVAVGWLLGLVALRVSGIYLAIVTLGFLQTVLTLLHEGGPFTGGGYGLVVPDQGSPLIGPIRSDDYVVVALVVAPLICGTYYSAVHSRVGRAWIAIKDHPAAAQLQGVDLWSLRTLAFALSSGLIALAGALQALLLGITNPSAYGPDVAVTHLSYVVVGGMTPSLIGPIVGPIILFMIPQFFHQLGTWLDLFYALLMLAVLTLAPSGVAGQVYELRDRLAGSAVPGLTRR